jgi:hypothetical protein
MSLTPLLSVLVINIGCALFVRKRLPSNIPVNQYRPDQPISKPFKKVVILNIDGGGLDMVRKLDLPTIKYLTQKGSHVKNGLLTVYRALTNPAFGTILTGATYMDVDTRVSKYISKYGYNVSLYFHEVNIMNPFNHELEISNKYSHLRHSGNAYGDSNEWYYVDPEIFKNEILKIV